MKVTQDPLSASQARAKAKNLGSVPDIHRDIATGRGRGLFGHVL